MYSKTNFFAFPILVDRFLVKHADVIGNPILIDSRICSSNTMNTFSGKLLSTLTCVGRRCFFEEFVIAATIEKGDRSLLLKPVAYI